jgi:selenocysteine lyase/cysteine desulfurase
LPQAAAHIKSLLGLPPDSPACSVQFGHNSHELVTRLLSALVGRRNGSAADVGAQTGAGAGVGDVASPLRVLTSSCEFYSVTRQLNRLMEAGLAEVEAVPAEPADSFAERCCAALAAAAAAGRPVDVVYVSTTTYLTQQTLVPSIPAFVRGLRAAAAATKPAQQWQGQGQGQPPATLAAPLIILDGYHGFAGLPTNLAEAAGDCCYVAGMLKHAGCGANCAFMTLPAQLAASVRPVLTGWLADPSVLSPSSPGISFGFEVSNWRAGGGGDQGARQGRKRAGLQQALLLHRQ